MYKKDLALNNLQCLTCHKTKPNQTKHNLNFLRKKLRNVVVNEHYCDTLASEFDLQSRFYVHFRTNTFGYSKNLLRPPSSMG